MPSLAHCLVSQNVHEMIARGTKSTAHASYVNKLLLFTAAALATAASVDGISNVAGDPTCWLGVEPGLYNDCCLLHKELDGCFDREFTRERCCGTSVDGQGLEQDSLQMEMSEMRHIDREQHPALATAASVDGISNLAGDPTCWLGVEPGLYKDCCFLQRELDGCFDRDFTRERCCGKTVVGQGLEQDPLQMEMSEMRHIDREQHPALATAASVDEISNLAGDPTCWLGVEPGLYKDCCLLQRELDGCFDQEFTRERCCGTSVDGQGLEQDALQMEMSEMRHIAREQHPALATAASVDGISNLAGDPTCWLGAEPGLYKDCCFLQRELDGCFDQEFTRERCCGTFVDGQGLEQDPLQKKLSEMRHIAREQLACDIALGSERVRNIILQASSRLRVLSGGKVVVDLTSGDETLCSQLNGTMQWVCLINRDELMFDAVSICFPEGCLHQPSQVVGVFLSERNRLHLGVRFGSVQPGLDFWTAYFAPDAAFFRVPLHAVVLALLTLEVCRMTVANHFVEGLKLCPSFGVAAILAPPDTKEMVMISAMRVFLGFTLVALHTALLTPWLCDMPEPPLQLKLPFWRVGAEVYTRWVNPAFVCMATFLMGTVAPSTDQGLLVRKEVGRLFQRLLRSYVRMTPAVMGHSGFVACVLSFIAACPCANSVRSIEMVLHRRFKRSRERWVLDGLLLRPDLSAWDPPFVEEMLDISVIFAAQWILLIFAAVLALPFKVGYQKLGAAAAVAAQAFIYRIDISPSARNPRTLSVTVPIAVLAAQCPQMPRLLLTFSGLAHFLHRSMPLWSGYQHWRWGFGQDSLQLDLILFSLSFSLLLAGLSTVRVVASPSKFVAHIIAVLSRLSFGVALSNTTVLYLLNVWVMRYHRMPCNLVVFIAWTLMVYVLSLLSAAFMYVFLSHPAEEMFKLLFSAERGSRPTTVRKHSMQEKHGAAEGRKLKDT